MSVKSLTCFQKSLGLPFNKALIKVTSYNKIPDVILKIFTRRSSFQSVMKTRHYRGRGGSLYLLRAGDQQK